MSNFTKEQLQSIVSVLYKARTDKQVKLRFGLRQRQNMLDSIRNNTHTDLYRYRWLVETRTEIIKMLGENAEKFNARYRHDSMSVQDFIDILESTLLLLKAANKG